MKITTDPQLTTINLFYKKDFYRKASNYMEAIKSYSKELDIAINYLKSKVANDPILAESVVFVDLDQQMKVMTSQFAAFWIKKYNLAHEKIKNEVNARIGTGTFYRPFGDSIGILARQETLYDENVLSIANKSFPVRYGSSLTNKIHPQRQLLYAECSDKLNKIFNSNIQNIQEKGAVCSNAHGENLIPDSVHLQRMQALIPTLTQRIQNEFKELYNVIKLYCEYNPQSSSQNIQFVPNYNITVSVEGTPVNQDILFNQLQELQKVTTTKIMLEVV